MKNILKIDNFANAFKSMYGLEGDGNSYIVKDPFYVEAILFYDRETKKGVTEIHPSWTRIKCEPGDLISVTENGCYLEITDSKGFVECRPERSTSEEVPNLDKFPEDKLERIGKNVLKCKPMSLEERKNISVFRV